MQPTKMRSKVLTDAPEHDGFSYKVEGEADPRDDLIKTSSINSLAYNTSFEDAQTVSSESSLSSPSSSESQLKSKLKLPNTVPFSSFAFDGVGGVIVNFILVPPFALSLPIITGFEGDTDIISFLNDSEAFFGIPVPPPIMKNVELLGEERLLAYEGGRPRRALPL